MESLQYDLEEKAENYAKVINELEGQIAIINSEKQRLDDKERSLNNNIKKMKEALKEVMLLSGKKKFKTNLFRFNIQKAGIRALVIDGQVPNEYLKSPEPNTTAIRELLKTTTVDWAHFNEPTEHLSIR